jgi:hypothetical protein
MDHAYQILQAFGCNLPWPSLTAVPNNWFNQISGNLLPLTPTPAEPPRGTESYSGGSGSGHAGGGSADNKKSGPRRQESRPIS